MDYLKEIYVEDIDLLLKDLQLEKRGYEINYIIDPGDIFAYTFPFGLKFQYLDRPTEDIGDEFIAYEYIFKNFRPIVLDEYRIELLTNRNSVMERLDKRLNKAFDDVLTEGQIEDIINNYTRNISFLFSCAIMGKSFISKFDDVYFNKLQVDTLRTKNEVFSDQNVLIDIYANNKGSEWSKQAFINWVRSNYGQKRNSNESDEEILTKFKNTYRDYIVIDRVFRINDAIQKSTSLKNKYVFLYFSKAPKSSSIFDTAEVESQQPEIGEFENYTLLRSPKHSYLLFLVFNEDKNIMEDFLVKLREIAEKKESNVSLSDKLSMGEGPKFTELVESLSKRRRDLLEHTLINYQIKNIDQYKIAVHKKVRRLAQHQNKVALANLYRNLLSEAKIMNEDVALAQMDLSYSLHHRLLSVVKMMLDKRDFTISKGKDQIRGTFHHLPILLFFDRNSQIDALRQKLLLEIVDFVVQSHHMRQAILSQFLESIRNLYEVIEKYDSISDQYYDILINYFIYSVIEDAEKDQGNALKALEESLEMLELQPVIENKWADDYIYMLIWAYRRNNKLDESLKLSIEGTQRFNQDPRFEHGKCLALYNKYVSVNTLDSCSYADLMSIVESAESAIMLYEIAMGRPDLYRKEYNRFVLGNINSLYNLVIYVLSLYYLQQYDIGGEIDESLSARYPLSKLRNFYLSKIKEIEGAKNKEFPECSHTEAVLELVEAINYFRLGQPSDKIKNAREAIKMSLEREPFSQLYLQTEGKIDEWEKIIFG